MIKYKIRGSDWLTFSLIIVNFNHFFIQPAPGLQFTTKQTCQTVKFFFAQGCLRHFLRGTDTYVNEIGQTKTYFFRLDHTFYESLRQFLIGSITVNRRLLLLLLRHLLLLLRRLLLLTVVQCCKNLRALLEKSHQCADKNQLKISARPAQTKLYSLAKI